MEFQGICRECKLIAQLDKFSKECENPIRKKYERNMKIAVRQAKHTI